MNFGRQPGNLIITPKFIPRGWRVLRPREEVEKGDYFWSKVHKCYFPAGKGKVGYLAREPLTFVRRIIN